MIKILLDSTYILLSFGIKVKGISDDHIVRLREAYLQGQIKFYCLTIVWIEIIGKVCKESERLGVDVHDILRVAIKSLLESGFYQWIAPNAEAVKLAFELRMLGHKDIIDNLLYATSITEDMVFLTMDEEFKEFLRRNGFNTENIMNHEQLLEKLKS
ncbi:MAG: hypothetical protein J7J99_01860 [Thermoprotei archaeon]|nr:hypothetical protein [Thermoprotei archaeon]